MKTLERRNWFEHIMKHHSAFIEGRIARYAAPGFCDNRASFLNAPWRWWYKRGKILCDWSTLHVMMHVYQTILAPKYFLILHTRKWACFKLCQHTWKQRVDSRLRII